MREDDIERAVTFDTTSSWTAESLRDELARSWAQVWVRRRDGLAVAYLVVWFVVDEFHVLNLTTHPDERRRGHARALLHHGLTQPRETPLKLALLEVRRNNLPAITLYESLGFRTVGERARYYDDGEDALEMKLSLNEDLLRSLASRAKL